MKAFFEQSVDWLHRAVTGPRHHLARLTPLFALIFLGLLLAAIALSLILDGFCGFPPFPSPLVGSRVGTPLIVAGAWLWLWCVAKFWRRKGTPVPVNPPPTLITDGPYAFSRNPMMAGVFLILAGLGLLWGSIWLTFITTPVIIAVSVVVIKNIEEPELERRFGEPYRQYRARTPRLFPRWPRRGDSSCVTPPKG